MTDDPTIEDQDGFDVRLSMLIPKELDEWLMTEQGTLLRMGKRLSRSELVRRLIVIGIAAVGHDPQLLLDLGPER